jgi:hypothetical protein
LNEALIFNSILRSEKLVNGTILFKHTLRRALQQDRGLKPGEGKPMEMRRAHISADSIIEYFAALKHVADNNPKAFASNLDEIGHSD